MNVTVERPRPCEVALTIEVGPEQMEQAVDRAYREFSKYVRIPGFRPGKAPRNLLEQMLDADAVKQRAREIVVGAAYKAAIEQEKIEPFDQGTVDEVTEDPDKPMVIKATVPLRPEVDIPDYDGLKADATPRPVTDSDVQERLNLLLSTQTRLVPTADPAAQGDTVFADLDTYVGGEAVGATRSATFVVGNNMPEIDAVLVGAKGGDTRETDVEYPADYADATFAGKTVHFTLRVNHVMHRAAPELTEEWVKENTRFESVDEMRAALRADMEAEAVREAEAGVRSQLLRQLVERSRIEFPTALVDREVAKDLQALNKDIESRGGTMERYLQAAGKTMQQLQDEMALAATTRLKNGLVLGHIAQTENLRVTPDELNAELARLAQKAGMKVGEYRRRVKDEGRMADLEEQLLQQKLFDFLKSKATITGQPGEAE
jgi:trigger factor